MLRVYFMQSTKLVLTAGDDRSGLAWLPTSSALAQFAKFALKTISTNLGGLSKQGLQKEFSPRHWKFIILLLCDAIVHAFILCLTDRGLQFTDKPKVQHVARASTGQQSKSLRLPPLVPQFASKLVAMYARCASFPCTGHRIAFLEAASRN